MRVLVDAGILTDLDMHASARILLGLLQVLVKANLEYMKVRGVVPHPYKAKVRYKREPGRERWKGIGQILRDGHGDCEDLASYLCAWYLHRGYQAQLRLVGKRIGKKRLFHVTVIGPRGPEDPSKVLGMKGTA